MKFMRRVLMVWLFLVGSWAVAAFGKDARVVVQDTDKANKSEAVMSRHRAFY